MLLPFSSISCFTLSSSSLIWNTHRKTLRRSQAVSRHRSFQLNSKLTGDIFLLMIVINSVIISSRHADAKSGDIWQLTKHFWSFTAKHCCSILVNNWSRWCSCAATNWHFLQGNKQLHVLHFKLHSEECTNDSEFTVAAVLKNSQYNITIFPWSLTQ